MVPATALPNRICPLCGGANLCAPATAGTLDVPCWCTKATIDREALARVPTDLVDKACLCPRCAGLMGPRRVRVATLDDIPALETLIACSIRTLGAGDYTAAQIEAALRGAFGVDTQLIRDRSYFVVEENAERRLVACGGWSRRRTLFGSDAREGRDAAELDPATDAARIRAFFVAPEAARQGIGTLLLEHCEAQARAHGFRRFELMATLPGVRLYAARGYRPGTPIRHRMTEDLTIEFVPMAK